MDSIFSLFPKRTQTILKKRGITNDYQLRRFFPFRYIDASVETGIDPKLADSHVTIIGKFTDCVLELRQPKYITCSVIDRKSGQAVRIYIFGKNHLHKYMRTWINSTVIVSGKLTYRNGRPLIGNPDVLSTNIEKNMILHPVYHNIKGVDSEKLKAAINRALSSDEDDTLPDDLRDELSLLPINTALKYLHNPTSFNEVSSGKRRLLFDDLYYLAGRFILSERKVSSNGVKISNDELTRNIIEALPYELTKGQLKTYEAFRSLMMNGKRIKALVQGDVGCGKTITAFLAMLLAAGNGFQSALMAPTKILAKQHYDKLSAFLQGTDIKCVFLSGAATSKKDLKALESGEALIAVGTQSLISDKVKFNNLSLIVVDEEHKFGVVQRRTLEEKQESVNYISMSATPIPRTLANALYGSDTEIFTIKDMPGNRKPVKTFYDNGALDCVKTINFARKILEHKHQIYVVCPMIESSADGSVMEGITSTTEALTLYRRYLPKYRIEELTGTMAPEDTERTLEDFRSGKINVLVSTTVVEVGVDVPNATLIIIHNAERFGLSGLHQLRGRVGRGSAPSYCILVSPVSPRENPRLMTMCNTTDGFEISKKDLELRRSGNIFGEEQSGMNIYIEEMLQNEDRFNFVISHARKQTDEILKHHIQRMLTIDFM